MKPEIKVRLFGITLMLAAHSLVLAGGTVTTCDETSLRAALAGGGLVTFSCDGTIALTQTIAISNTTTLDASGHAVTLSGDQAVRVFRVENPATLSLVNLSIANGMAAGTNGGPSVDGESGEGGAIYNSGTVNALGCLFTNNFAKGGRGGATTNTLGPPNGNGGSASGGAIFNQGGTLNLTNCQLLWNGSYGGTGAVYSLYSIVSSGGAARGGAVSSQGGTARFVDCVFNSNQTKAGPGTRYGIVGAGFGSNAYGGALCSSTGEVWLIRCSVFANTNQATACRDASGGAVYATGGDLQVVSSWFQQNATFGGNGIQGGSSTFIPAGAALGGAAGMNAATFRMTNSTFSNNRSLGGNGLSWGTVGSAYGGAIFNSGTVYAENCTVHGNTARAGEAGYEVATQGSGYGGGVCNNGGTAVLSHVTLARNSAEHTAGGTAGTGAASGGGLYTANGTTSLRSSIVANSLSGSNSFGTLTDLGYNLSSDASCSFAGAGSLNSTDPKLGPLDAYGGPTPTMALLSGSPAIDAGDSVTFPGIDQRGRGRPYGPAPDIGAFESSAPFVIRGTVSGFTLDEEVEVITASVTAPTMNRGSYSLEGLAAGTYSVGPVSSNFVFYPTNRLVTVGPDQLGVNFKAYRWNELSLEGTSNGVFHVAFAGTNGVQYRVLGSSNLFDWFPVSTNLVSTSNLFEYFDPAMRSNRTRFYKTVSP